MSDFDELWKGQNLSVQTSLNEVTVYMNEELLDVLLNNLLGNATKHNCENGRISIVLDQSSFMIANTSEAPPLKADGLYQRFNKISSKNENTGLGLSIVKQICDSSGYMINYRFFNHQQVFFISWKHVPLYK
jgi:signal transduction histidine kinase